MKLLIILLITLSFNTAYAQFRIERIDTRNDSSQGFIEVDTLEEANKRFNKMLKVKKTWMEGKWKKEAPVSITKQISNFFSEDTCNNFKITKVEQDAEGNEVTYYLHPETFDFKCTNITEEVEAKRLKVNKKASDLASLKKLIIDEKANVKELNRYLKLRYNLKDVD